MASFINGLRTIRRLLLFALLLSLAAAGVGAPPGLAAAYPQISFSSGAYEAEESADTVTLTVQLDPPGLTTVTVNYRTENGTATAGSDYTSAAGTLTFPAGQVTQSFTIDLLEDGLVEADETIAVTLFNPVAGELSLTKPVTATVTIGDNDGFEDAGMQFDGSPNDSFAWGDYDRDGDLDLAHTGTLNGTSFHTRILTNSFGTLSQISLPTIQGVSDSTLEWGDFDSDGDLDLLLIGKAAGVNYTRLYRNNLGGAGSAFAEMGQITLDSGDWARGAWGDYDNDGDLDLLLTFSITGDAAGARTRLYRNNTNVLTGVNFSSVATNLTNLYKGAIAWGDYDNDGNLDLALTGVDNANYSRSIIYRNNGSGSFVNVVAVLQGVNNGGAAWGDFDNDGDLDLAVSGCKDSASPCGAYSTRLYRNEDGQFYDTYASLPGAGGGRDLSWGDYDNDGDLDLLISGVNGGVSTSLYRNEDGAFIDARVPNLSGTFHGPNAWGDYDNDGDLDLVLSQVTGSTAAARIFRSRQSFHNTPPTAPSGLSAKVLDKRVELSWSAPTDAQTPTAGLTYALRVGTTPGGVDILAPNAVLESGQRFLPGPGGAQLSTSALLSPPLDKVYYWSIQAVDTGYAGSPFSEEGTFFTTSAWMEFNESMFKVSEGQSQAVITVTLSKAIAYSISVDYHTEDYPGAPRALAGIDYTTASGTLTFAPGETSQTFTVPFLTDDLDENDEPLRLVLSNPSNGKLGSLDVASLTIVDDDAQPSLSVSEPVPGTDEASAFLELTVSLSAPSGLPVTVDYAAADGEGPDAATAPGDYTSTGGRLTFAPGVQARTLTIPLQDDTQDEYDETFTLTLSSATNAALPAQPATQLTILDNDSPPLVQFQDAALEADETQGQAPVIVTLDRASGKTVKVNYDVTAGTAAAGVDFTAQTGELLIFAPNETTKQIDVSLINDHEQEADETILLQLSGAVEAKLGIAAATLTIAGNDTPPTASFSAAAYHAAENAGSALITVRLDGPGQFPASIDYQTGGGTATSGIDYEAASGTLTFAAGEIEKTFTITIHDNQTDHENRTVQLSLHTRDYATLGSVHTALLTIEDDEDKFWVFLPALSK